MIATDLIEFLAEHDNGITLMVRAHGGWHPVDAVTITSGPDGGLVARLEAADAMPPAVGFASRLATDGEPCACCKGDPNTVCSACGEHSCWAGVMYCDDYKTAGTRQKSGGGAS